MLIDRWLSDFLDIASSSLSPGYHAIILPELQIARLGNKPARVTKHGNANRVTYLTGSTDYALWIPAAGKWDRQHESKFKTSRKA
jgi:hypothetical protein